jgi:hypothetical protein
MKHEEAKARLLEALSRRVGAEKALSMAELFELIYQRPVTDRINDTRQLRKLVTSLRLDGVPIASVSRSDGGGYFLVSAASELDDYLDRLRRRGLRALDLEARLRGVSLSQLLGRMRAGLEGGDRAAAG